MRGIYLALAIFLMSSTLLAAEEIYFDSGSSHFLVSQYRGKTIESRVSQITKSDRHISFQSKNPLFPVFSVYFDEQRQANAFWDDFMGNEEWTLFVNKSYSQGYRIGNHVRASYKDIILKNNQETLYRGAFQAGYKTHVLSSNQELLGRLVNIEWSPFYVNLYVE